MNLWMSNWNPGITPMSRLSAWSVLPTLCSQLSVTMRQWQFSLSLYSCSPYALLDVLLYHGQHAHSLTHYLSVLLRSRVKDLPPYCYLYIKLIFHDCIWTTQALLEPDLVLRINAICGRYYSWNISTKQTNKIQTRNYPVMQTRNDPVMQTGNDLFHWNAITTPQPWRGAV